MAESSGLASRFSSNVLRTMRIIGNHDPLLDIPRQSLLGVIDTFWYLVQLLVPVELFAHAIPHMLLTYCLWHIYAFQLPLVS